MLSTFRVLRGAWVTTRAARLLQPTRAVATGGIRGGAGAAGAGAVRRASPPHVHPTLTGSGGAAPPKPAVAAQSAVRAYFKSAGDFAKKNVFGGGSSGKMVPAASWAALSEVPPLPLILGLSGLIPFVFLASPISSLIPMPEAIYRNAPEWQAAYGAIILSFLGGVHWGLAVAPGAVAAGSTGTAARFVWSVTPSLIAWPALMMPAPLNYAMLVAGLGTAFAVDASYASRGLLGPPWFIVLRRILTTVAAASLTSTLIVKAIPIGRTEGSPDEAAPGDTGCPKVSA